MIPTTVKAGVAAALALAAAPHVAGPTSRSTPAGFLGALVTQALVGITLGLFTMILVNALQAAGALVDLFAGLLARRDLRPDQPVERRDLRPLLRARRGHAALHHERVPAPRQRLVPVVQGRARARARVRRHRRTCSRRTSGSSSSPRSRSRARCSAACSSPRSRSACSRAPRRASTCSRSRSRCASSSR